MVLTGDSFLVTNAHVVGAASEGTAEFADGTVTGFRVVGRDPLSDIAIIRADRDAKTVVRDRLTFELRAPLRVFTPIIAAGIGALFAHRQRRLQRHFGPR